MSFTLWSNGGLNILILNYLFISAGFNVNLEEIIINGYNKYTE